jgi:hypothetical protein
MPVCSRCGCVALGGHVTVRVTDPGPPFAVTTRVLCNGCGARVVEFLSRAAAVLAGTR